MKFQTLLSVALLASLLAPLARAEEEKMLKPEEKEKYFQILCVPGSAAENELPADKKAEALELRELFHKFLADPQTVLASALKVALDKDSGFADKIGAAATIGLTCGLAMELEADISARGCQNAAGVKREAKSAVAYCADVIKQLEAANAEDEGEQK